MAAAAPARVPKIYDTPELRATVAGAKRGEQDCWDSLRATFQPQISNVARNVLRHHDHMIIDDVTQNAWLKVFRYLPRFKHHSKFSTWLIRIVVNEALMVLRKERGKARYGYEFSIDASPSADENGEEFRGTFDLPGPVDPERLYQQKQASKLLAEAIETLPDTLRGVAQLQYQGLTLSEVKEVLNISTVAVKTRSFRVRKRLRRDYLLWTN